MTDLLIPLGMPDADAYLVLSAEDRLQSAAMLHGKLLKCVSEWKTAVQRLDTINPQMPEKIVADIRNRWLTAIEEWTSTRDSLMRLRLSQAEIEAISHAYHRKAGLDAAARLSEQWLKQKKDPRELASAIRKL